MEKDKMDDSKTKSRKKKIILILIPVIIIAFAAYSHYVFRTWDPSEAFGTWKSVALNGNDIEIIRKGIYSSGDTTGLCNGYVFVRYGCSEVEAMNKMGFYDIGHTYENGAFECTEYCTSESGDHAIIAGKTYYLGGYMMKYRIVGIC
ncbi:MAG: hypothetical protein Q4E74_01740 [Ruminococcus sp.]|nr:hypothetical protein [Ruminococcus sp.]